MPRRTCPLFTPSTTTRISGPIVTLSPQRRVSTNIPAFPDHTVLHGSIGYNHLNLRGQIFQKSIVKDPTKRLTRRLNGISLQRQIGDGFGKIDILERRECVSGY